MKSLNAYINEDKTKDRKKKEINKKHIKERGKIKFTIWQAPDKKVRWLNDNEKYQKIDYKYFNDKKGITIVFLLGYDPVDDSWKLWTGKLGVVSYSDDPYCSFETNKFAEAILAALDKVEEIIKDIEHNPKNWPQYYDEA